MVRLRLPLILAGAVLCAGAGAAAWAAVQQNPDSIDQVLQNGAPVVKGPTKLKPREDMAPPDNGPAAASQGAAPEPSDEEAAEPASGAPPATAAAAKPTEPLKRPRYAVAVLQALDKVTAETVRFEAPVNQPVRYKTLVFTVRACETTASDEASSDAAAHVEIDSQPKGPEGAPPSPARQVFRGWMFASSPGLNLVEHPIYDAWLIACKDAAPAA
jgi:hypothetical protein